MASNQDIVEKAQELLVKLQSKLDSAENSGRAVRPTSLPNAKETTSQRIGIDSLRGMADGRNSNELVFHENPAEKTAIEGTAVIYGFWGTDVNRIEAATGALKCMLKSNPAPADIVFVEAQLSKSAAAFGWLKNYGVKYIFKKYGKDSEGLFLKTALWNIGAANTDADRLCFVDSDVAFCNAGWLIPVNEAFGQYDVLSLAGHVYYANENARKNTVDSIGHTVMTSHETKFSGHPGFTLGMARGAYEKYGRFEAFNMHDDIWIWQRILGSENYPDQPGWNPYKSTEDMTRGMPFKVGSTEECCCHIGHGGCDSDTYKLYGYASSLACKKPFDDIDYDKTDVNRLPVWSKRNAGSVVRAVFSEIRKRGIDCKNRAECVAKRMLFEARTRICGEIDKSHPLMLVTSFVPDFKNKSFDAVVKHRQMIERHCTDQFEYVCITDETPPEQLDCSGINVIPRHGQDINERTFGEFAEDNIVFPRDSTVIYLPIGLKIEKQFSVFRTCHSIQDCI